MSARGALADRSAQSERLPHTPILPLSPGAVDPMVITRFH